MTQAPAKPENIGITELCHEIINRKSNTVRKWEREGSLPKRLHGHRGSNGRRYWTHEQVYGKNGLLEWMKKHDMRPGNALADPRNADKHVDHLRKPKYIKRDLLLLAQTMCHNKASVEEILNEIYPHTQYVSKDRLERALRKYFKANGWWFPPKQKKQRASTNRRPRNLERDLTIVSMHLDLKATYKEIADHFGISEQRVREIIRKHQEQ